jgi:hypothetical protein
MNSILYIAANFPYANVRRLVGAKIQNYEDPEGQETIPLATETRRKNKVASKKEKSLWN